MNEIINYVEYKFSTKGLIINLAAITIGIVFMAKLFYGNYLVGVFFLPALFWLIKERRASLLRRRRREFKGQFRDAILAMADIMTVGYSVENAVEESCTEMAVLYGKDSMICRELGQISKKVGVKVPIEKAFRELAEKTKIDDVVLFSEIFSIAKRSGGNIVTVIKSVASNISQSIQVEEEIKVSINEKKVEFQMMSVVPICLILYMNITSGNYLDTMYGTWVGKLIMTGCLAVYAGVCIWGYRMCESFKDEC